MFIILKRLAELIHYSINRCMSILKLSQALSSLNTIGSSLFLTFNCNFLHSRRSTYEFHPKKITKDHGKQPKL